MCVQMWKCMGLVWCGHQWPWYHRNSDENGACRRLSSFSFSLTATQNKIHLLQKKKKEYLHARLSSLQKCISYQWHTERNNKIITCIFSVLSCSIVSSAVVYYTLTKLYNTYFQLMLVVSCWYKSTATGSWSCRCGVLTSVNHLSG